MYCLFEFQKVSIKRTVRSQSKGIVLFEFTMKFILNYVSIKGTYVFEIFQKVFIKRTVRSQNWKHYNLNDLVFGLIIETSGYILENMYSWKSYIET